jgi:hypothetical protein
MRLIGAIFVEDRRSRLIGGIFFDDPARRRWWTMGGNTPVCRFRICGINPIGFSSIVDETCNDTGAAVLAFDASHAGVGCAARNGGIDSCFVPAYATHKPIFTFPVVCRYFLWPGDYGIFVDWNFGCRKIVSPPIAVGNSSDDLAANALFRAGRHSLGRGGARIYVALGKQETG